MELIHKENHLPFSALDFLHHILHPLFEFASILGASYHEPEVQGEKLFTLERFGDFAGCHARGEPFGDCRLPHSRLADEHRVVLGATCKNLNHSINLLVAADDWIELVLGGELGEIARILGEGTETFWFCSLSVLR